MLARRLPGILPPPTYEEALEITRVQSVAGGAHRGIAAERPFRAPHHTISPQGLVGGGVRPAPGEITLAHRGVLFLDELAEFSSAALDALRRPAGGRDGRHRPRAALGARIPARAMLVGAANPCPCGRPAARRASAGSGATFRYRRRLSGPLLDRIDLLCHVGLAAGARAGAPGRATARALGGRSRAGDGGAGAAAEPARRLRRARQRRDGRPADPPHGARSTTAAIEQLRVAADTGALSGRGHDRVLRVARTIADLEGAAEVSVEHVDEALGYRRRRVRGGGVSAALRRLPAARAPDRGARGLDPGACSASGRGPAGARAVSSPCSDEELVAAVAPARRGEGARRSSPSSTPTRCAAAGRAPRSAPVCRHAGRYPAELLALADRARGAVLPRRAGPWPALTSEPVVAIVGTRRRLGVRPRGGHPARARPGGRGRHRGQRAGARDRRRGAPRLRRRPAGAAIAVLAGGADVPYPRRHRGLYERIRERGVIVSELPPGQPPCAGLSGAQPDHGRPRADDGRGRGGRAVGVADHGAVRAPPRPRRWARCPGSVTSCAAPRARTSCFRRRRSSCAACRTCSTSSTASAAGPRRRERAAAAASPGSSATCSTRSRRASTCPASSAVAGLPAREVRAALARLEVAGLVRRGGMGGYMRTAQPR